MKRYEYVTVNNASDALLCRYGKEGWVVEAATRSPHAPGWHVLLSREIPEEEHTEDDDSRR